MRYKLKLLGNRILLTKVEDEKPAGEKKVGSLYIPETVQSVNQAPDVFNVIEIGDIKIPIKNGDKVMVNFSLGKAMRLERDGKTYIIVSSDMIAAKVGTN